VLTPTPPSDVTVIRSVHVSTKNSSGHDIPYPHRLCQDDFASRLHPTALYDIMDAEPNQIAPAQFAVDSAIERVSRA